MAGLLAIIPNGVFTSFYAEASQRGARPHHDERRAILLAIGLLIPGIAAMWLLAVPLLILLGGASESYAVNALGVLQILIFSSIPVFLNSILTTRIRVRKRSLPLIIGVTISTSVTLGLGYFLLPTMGVEGVALAVVVGSAAATPYYYVVARRSFESEPLEPPAVQM